MRWNIRSSPTQERARNWQEMASAHWVIDYRVEDVIDVGVAELEE